MISEIRRFNDAGNSAFIRLLVDRPDDIASRAQALAMNDTLTIREPGLKSSFAEPKTRLELGVNLWPILGSNGPLSSFSTDPLLWNWIAAVLMDSVLGKPANLASIGEQNRWIADVTSRYFYRHLFAGAFFTYKAHHENPARAMAVLCQPIDKPGEMVGQIMATEDLGYSVAAEVATLLFFDTATGTIKKGVSGKGPGTVRRLTGDFLNQLKLTVDFKGMTALEILDLLPPEFNHLKPSASKL